MKTYIEFLESAETASLFIDYYTGKITGTELYDGLKKASDGIDQQEGLLYYLDIPEHFSQSASPTSSGSILSGVYDCDFDDAPEGWYDRAEKISFQIIRTVRNLSK